MMKSIKQLLKDRVDPLVLENLVKGRDSVEINFNRLLQREYVPDPRERIYVETSGICNLLCRFCAYSKKELAKVVMPQERFERVVTQATAMGFRRIGLTPLTGEAFMDKRVVDKMRYLDSSPDIESYHFFTNFVLPDEKKITQLAGLGKLEYLHVSVYGHDEDSFCRLTQKGPKQYQRLVRNLEQLYQVCQEATLDVVIGWRSLPGFKKHQPPTNPLQQIVRRFEEDLGKRVFQQRIYNNWGGLIADQDVRDLGIPLNDGSYVYKKGPCALVFYRVCILADGRVNACACRDVNGELIIGQVEEQPLAAILSLENPRYRAIIEEQIANSFRGPCQSCDFYQSIYRRWTAEFGDRHYSLKQALEILEQE